MAVVCIDIETCLIRPGLPAPPVVCLSIFDPCDPSGPRLYGAHELVRPLLALLNDRRRHILGHNIAYDMCCLCEWHPALRELIFRAYDEGRILDTMPGQRIIEIETGDKRGKLALDMLCSRYGLHCPKDIEDEQGRAVRLGFGKFYGLNADQIPKIYREYAVGDTVQTHHLFRRMLERCILKRRDLAMLVRNDIGLKLTSAYGLCTDPERVDALEQQAKERIALLQDVLFKSGVQAYDSLGNLAHNTDGTPKMLSLLRWERNKPSPVRTQSAIRRLVAEAFGLKAGPKGEYLDAQERIEELQNQGVLTETGNYSMGRLVLEESGHPILAALAEYQEWGAVWNKDLKLFREAVDVPFHTRFGFAATTRTTSGGPNIQNFRKKAGIRECIYHPGQALVASDYTGLENATLAQVIYDVLGRRGMADKISDGWNFHAEVGAQILGWEGPISKERMLAFLARKEAGESDFVDCYNAAKPLNFGLPGFMTRAATVQQYARIGYGVNRTVEQWQALIDIWYATQHDQVAYLLEYVDAQRAGMFYNVPIPRTGIMRRGATRTAAANTGFQGLGGRCAEESLYLIAREQMLGRMPGRVCAFVHDENISACKPEDVEQVRYLQEYWMLKAAEQWLPDVKMHVSSVGMHHWAKKAKATRDSSGALLMTNT